MTRRRAETPSGTQPFDAPQSLVGRRLDDRFILEETLEIGSMGLLFEATQLSSSRSVVVKILRPSLADDTAAVRRFQREIEILSELSHPHIVSLIDSGRDAGGLHYMVMEHIEGTTFERALQQSMLTLEALLEILIDTSSALAEAHHHSIVHRDLWFDNILLAEQADDRFGVTLIDFGIAKPLEARARWDITQQGEVPGTPAIVAPELIDGASPSPASDLYSLGVLSYTALVGEPPFEGQHDLELMRAHKEDSLPDFQKHLPDRAPEDWMQLTRQLLAKDPDGRPSGAVEVRERLEDVRHTLETSASRVESTSSRQGDTRDLSEDASDTRERGSTRGPIQRFIRWLFGEDPIRAPSSVVFYLTLLLLLQIMIIIYLLMSP